jgi:metal transporter CNNM
MAADLGCCATQFWLYVLVIIGLVCFAGLMAGLTLGLMSLGLVDLEVLIKSGRPKDRLYAGTSLSNTSSSFLSFPLFVFFCG